MEIVKKVTDIIEEKPDIYNIELELEEAKKLYKWVKKYHITSLDSVEPSFPSFRKWIKTGGFLGRNININEETQSTEPEG